MAGNCIIALTFFPASSCCDTEVCFPAKLGGKKGKAPAAFCKVVFIFFVTFGNFLGLPLLQGSPGGLTRILTSLFFLGMF